MSIHFIESRGVTSWLSEHVPDEVYARFQQLLAHDPESGDVMPGCGGLRKARIADSARQQGKRGGGRMVYLYVPDASRIYLLAAYSKDKSDDLTPEEKKQLKALAKTLRAEAIEFAIKDKEKRE
jgi:hypothetical protein